MTAYWPSWRRLAAGLFASVAVLACSASAQADTATITVTDTGGRVDPAGGIPRIFTVSGTASVAEKLYVKYKGVGTQCAPTWSSDTGDQIGAGTGYFVGDDVNGAFSFQHVLTWDEGTFQFCIWLAKSSGTIASPISQVITFRRPNGSISATLDPAISRPGQQTTVTVTGSSEANRKVYATVRSAGTQCAPTYGSDDGESLIAGSDVDGMFTTVATTTPSRPGGFIVCLWLASSSYDTQPIAGPQSVPFSVVQPPPALRKVSLVDCSNNHRLTAIRARSNRAACVRYQFSVTPLSGQKLSVSFVGPGGRTYSRATATWSASASSVITMGPLGAPKYRHRRGLWHAVLQVDRKRVASTSFRVR